MKKLILIYLFFLIGNNFVNAQTTLAAGDIAIIAYNADGTDEFSFIPLKDLAAGTVINFTDFGWTSESNGFQLSCNVANTSGAVTDGAITWTAPAGGVLFGKQVHIVCGGTSLSASHGTVVGLQATANVPTEYMSLSPGGDQIFAFQGTLGSPTLITAIGMNGAWDATLLNCTFTSTASVFPAALNATTSVAIIPETDNAKYNCSVTTGTAAQLRTAIFNVANWDVDNTNPFTQPIACFGSALPITLISFSGKAAENGNLLIWKTSNEKNFSHFEIERSGNTQKFEKIGKLIGTVSEEYTFLDNSQIATLNSQISYYRLKMIDLDGKYSYSKIIFIENNLGKTDIGQIYPNPAENKALVNITTKEASTWKITTYNVLGAIIHTQEKVLKAGNNVVEITNTNKGMNYIRFENGKHAETRKIIRQ